MLRNIPVVLEGFKFLAEDAPAVKMTGDLGKPQVVAMDKATGAQLFTVTLMARPPADPSTGRPSKPAIITVTLEMDPGDAVGEGDRVELVNPRVSYWENDGRSGMSWRAATVVPASAAKKSAAA